MSSSDSSKTLFFTVIIKTTRRNAGENRYVENNINCLQVIRRRRGIARNGF